MRCIFCKENSDNSKSIEHIIPESLGNTEHVLNPGWVCDSCNNYFSRKVEAPFLNSNEQIASRFSMAVPSKKQRIPKATGFMLGNQMVLDIFWDREKGLCLAPACEEDLEKFIQCLKTNKNGSLIIPTVNAPKKTYEVSRFIGKIALEILALGMSDIPESNDELVDKPELDELRNYVRRGKPGFIWPVKIRSIYPATKEFNDQKYGQHQVLHEFDLLFIPSKKNSFIGEYYAVVAIFGIEYVINLGAPELDSYNVWLEENGGQSFLQLEKV